MDTMRKLPHASIATVARLRFRRRAHPRNREGRQCDRSADLQIGRVAGRFRIRAEPEFGAPPNRASHALTKLNPATKTSAPAPKNTPAFAVSPFTTAQPTKPNATTNATSRQ